MIVNIPQKIQSTIQELNRVQDNFIKWTRGIATLEILKGRLIQDISLTTGSNSIEHKLGRTPLGWIVVDRDGTATVYKSSANSRTLELTSSGSVDISLWVF